TAQPRGAKKSGAVSAQVAQATFLQSCRNANTGSIREAFLAGIKDAAAARRNSNTGATRNVVGSRGSTPKSMEARYRVRMEAATIPENTANSARARLCPTTIRTT